MSIRPVRHLGLLALVLALAACGTPQEQCIRASTRDLGTLDRLIVGIEGDIARGYAIDQIEVIESRWIMCRVEPVNDDDAPSFEMCFEDFARLVNKPRAIDLDAERRKLASMKTKRTELARAAAPAIAACRAQYPES